TRKDHTRNVLSTELAQTMESTPSQLTPAQVSAASRLLGSALSPKIASLHRYHLPELSALNQVFGQLNHCIQIPKPNSGTVTEKVTETGGNTDTETVTEVVTETEALKSLFRQALRYESWILNQNIASPTAHHVYSDGLPIVYDGLLALEKTYQNEIQNFRTNTRIQLGSISCMILCCALCLVFIMLLMSILGLPTDWRIWILTLGVVLFAFLLAWLIANQSDIDRNHANIRYAIFTGTPPTEIPEVH
ncbi:MAG: hypothetical protein Q4C70_14635, partial [Planctomycetia bacterium]|nr:hypothetical protein [Planctomycetia bacterium]